MLNFIRKINSLFTPLSPTDKFIKGVTENNPAIIAQALAEGARVDTLISGQASPYKLPADSNPLLWACMRGYLDAVRCLLQHGAKHKDEYGQTALHWVAQYENEIPNAFEIVKLLVKHTDDLNALDAKRENALFWLVARNGSIEIARFLIRKGAIVDIQDPNGDTPLILAMSAINKDMVKLLLKEGKANPDLKNNNGDTARLYGEFDDELRPILIKYAKPLNSRYNLRSKAAIQEYKTPIKTRLSKQI